MRLLLDSHIFLWYAAEPSPLNRSTLEAIERADAVYVSAVTIWELSIKASSGRLPEQRPLADLARLCGFGLLNLTPEHGEAILQLPHLHRDPFDRMLIAQARIEGLTLVTHDALLARYDVPVLLV